MSLVRSSPSLLYTSQSPQNVPVFTHMLLYAQRLSQYHEQNSEISFVNMSELDPWLKTADATSNFEKVSARPRP